MSKAKTQDKLPATLGDYEEERIPFDQVLRKLVSTKPARKPPKAPAPKQKKG